MVVVSALTSRPLYLVHWCIWSFPLVALVESQRQSPIPPTYPEPTAIVLATGICYFVCSTNLMLKKTSQSMSYSCCGWHSSVPVSNSSHQRPACKLNSQAVKEQHKFVLLRLCIVFLWLLVFLAGLCVLQLTVCSGDGREGASPGCPVLSDLWVGCAGCCHS